MSITPHEWSSTGSTGPVKQQTDKSNNYRSQYGPPPKPKEPEKRDDERDQTVETDMLGFLRFSTRETWKRVETKHTYTWTGPRIDVAKWREVQAFFRYVNNTYKSEAVCRIFINNKLGTWAFWAFPQEVKPGLEALEVDGGELRQAQRAQFRNSEGWEAFGSIHSHCNASAFQSGTDRKDESTNDGIHVTIGRVSDPKMDMHWRISMSGQSFDIKDISDIWPEFPALNSLSLPVDMLNKIVEHDACKAPDPEQSFPNEWKENLIPKEHLPAVYQSGTGSYQASDGSKVYVPTKSPGLTTGSPREYYGGYGYGVKSGGSEKEKDDSVFDYDMEKEAIAKEMVDMFVLHGSKTDEMDKIVEKLATHSLLAEMVDYAAEKGITSSMLADSWLDCVSKAEEELARRKELKDPDLEGYEPTYGID